MISLCFKWNCVRFQDLLLFTSNFLNSLNIDGPDPVSAENERGLRSHPLHPLRIFQPRARAAEEAPQPGERPQQHRRDEESLSRARQPEAALEEHSNSSATNLIPTDKLKYSFRISRTVKNLRRKLFWCFKLK